MAQMVPDNSNKMGFTFESDAAASFLVIKCNAKVLEYQALMLEHNRIRHVIPVDVVRKEGTAFFYYNITSKISLPFFLNRRKLNRKEFLKLLLHITTAVNDSAGYLLTDSNFIFNPEYLYISPETLEPALIYVPVSQDAGGGAALQGFISDMVLQHINVDGFGSGNFVQRILASVNSEMFHIKGLITLLNELLYEQEPDQDNIAAAELEKGESRDGETLLRTGKEEKWGKKIKGVCDGKTDNRKAVSEAKVSEGKAVTNGAVEDNTMINGVAEDKTAVAGKVPWVTASAILAQVVMGGVIYSCRGFLNNVSDNPTATYAAVAMIVLAIEVLIYKWLSAAKLIHLEAGQESRIIDGQKETQVYIDSASTVTETASELAAVSVHPTNRASCKTELLGYYTKGTRILKSTGKQADDEDILIDKDDFIIGRLEGHADHILKNSAVGKLHAQLIYRNSACYVKDLNSVNGTFINSKRIDCNKEFELKENDRLQLANSEFVFIIR